MVQQSFEFDFSEALKRLVRYVLEGLCVGISVQLITHKKILASETLLIGITSAAVLSLLDSFSPAVSSSARSGIGLGIGASTVGYGGMIPLAGGV